jgi:hypothetical protein
LFVLWSMKESVERHHPSNRHRKEMVGMRDERDELRDNIVKNQEEPLEVSCNHGRYRVHG